MLRWWAARLLDDEEHGSADAGDALDVAVDVADLARSVPRSGGTRAPEMPRMSDVADSAESGKGLGDLASGALDGLGSADTALLLALDPSMVRTDQFARAAREGLANLRRSAA